MEVPSDTMKASAVAGATPAQLASATTIDEAAVNVVKPATPTATIPAAIPQTAVLQMIQREVAVFAVTTDVDCPKCCFKTDFNSFTESLGTCYAYV